MLKSLRPLTKSMLALLAVTAAALLSAGISHLNLRSGIPFWQLLQFLIGEFQMGVVGPVSGPLPGGQFILDLYRIIFTIALVCFPFAVVLILISPELRRRMLRTALVLAVLIAAVAAVLSKQMQHPQDFEGSPLAPLITRDSLADSPFDDSFNPERISPWIARALGLLVAMTVIGVAAGIARTVYRSKTEARALHQIAAHARTAIDNISQGGNFENIIIRCYADMTQVVSRRRGLHRERSVTAREFTDYLLRADLPPDAVIKLTHLFEKARYGVTVSISPQEQETAIASLQAIVKACEEPTP